MILALVWYSVARNEGEPKVRVLQRSLNDMYRRSASASLSFGRRLKAWAGVAVEGGIFGRK